ncbi:hypothetical protein [Massilia sp. Dwa41.01b]|uniref:YhdP family protein n=1 Tax=Massilia sp. Dwa41.01b TaxID=2709302 RepID=UPI001E5FAA08|nr:hypothetical protein [Massilia sp. Dwa41.01b]
MPGFSNLSGAIDATDAGGSITLDSSALALHLPAWFADPTLPLDHLGLQARWRYQPGRQLLVELDKLEFVRGKLHGSLSGNHQLPLEPGHGPGVADFEGTLGGFQIAQVGRYLPLVTPEGLRGWLSAALQGAPSTTCACACAATCRASPSVQTTRPNAGAANSAWPAA